jgi:DUF1365 family protein
LWLLLLVDIGLSWLFGALNPLTFFFCFENTEELNLGNQF